MVDLCVSNANGIMITFKKLKGELKPDFLDRIRYSLWLSEIIDNQNNKENYNVKLQKYINMKKYGVIYQTNYKNHQN